uniref:Uncharacterized protein n=1 Tax=Spongospora subterranea TaxID=70186 RepID=A0A0H5QUZ5_9EUKA|eukprot:CRZ05739.1 hypothetical protein [Spongospora subterranea]
MSSSVEGDNSWSSATIRGQFLDAYISDGNADGFSGCLRSLAASLRNISEEKEWMSRFSPADAGSMATYVDVLAKSAELSDRIAAIRATTDDNALAKLITDFMKILVDLPSENGSVIVEGGLTDNDGSRIAISYLIIKRKDTFSLAICNTGRGAGQYHPTSGDQHIMSTILIDKIPSNLMIHDPAVSYVLLRMATKPSSEFSPAMLYR